MSDLTIFVITTGEESFDECIGAVKRQDLAGIREPGIEIIKDIFPVHEAFNEMHRRSKTPYFIQVDADVILDKDAVALLYKAIRRAGPFVYAAYGQLYEEGFGPGGSVRCWKRSIFNLFRFRDRRATDRDFYNRAMLLGLHRINVNKTLGLHKPRQSDLLDYWKTKGDVEKWQFLGRPFSKYAQKLYGELITKPEENKYKILGFMLGVLTSKERIRRSKDAKVEKERIEKIFYILNKNFNTFMLKEGIDFLGLSELAKKAYLNYSPAAKRRFTKEILGEFFAGCIDGERLEEIYKVVSF